MLFGSVFFFCFCAFFPPFSLLNVLFSFCGVPFEFCFVPIAFIGCEDSDDPIGVNVGISSPCSLFCCSCLGSLVLVNGCSIK